MTVDLWVLGGLMALSYIIGSVPFGFIAARIAGVNIIERGSGNIGATNVNRVLGVKYGIPVLIGDIGKGLLAGYLGYLYLDMGNPGALITGIMAIAGHNWSVFLKFRGGKGVATTAGVAIVAFPTLIVVAVLVFIVSIAVTRYVSVGSLLGVWSALGYSIVFEYAVIDRLVVLALALLITFTHRSNISRLLKGEESKLGEKRGK